MASLESASRQLARNWLEHTRLARSAGNSWQALGEAYMLFSVIYLLHTRPAMRQRTERKINMTDKWLRGLEAPPAPADPAKTATVLWWDSESPLIVKVSSRGGKSLMTWYHTNAGVLR
jgi:hypothetical protein